METHWNPFRSSFLSTFVALVVVGALLGLTGRSVAVPVFVEVPEFGQGATIPVAWADADGDGDHDLAVGNYSNGQNYLYRNDGVSFTELPKYGRRNTFAVVWGDLDNDGDADLAVGNSINIVNRVVFNNGGGEFSGRAEFGTAGAIGMAWADYDLDGDLDLALGNGILQNAEQNQLYRNDGDSTFVEIAEFGGERTASVTWGDYDGDGDPDLAVGNGGFGTVAQNVLYVNNGDGTFTALPEFGTGDTACLVWGDADGDGDLDLAVANWDGGQNYLYRNDAGAFAELPRFGLRDPNTMAWGDFDNDGDLDLAVGNGDFQTADQNYLYINEGGLTFTESAQFGLGSTDAVAWADRDGDGDLDLAVGNEHSTTQNYLYVNGENDADWFELKLVGHFHDVGSGYSNRDAIGAKVAVYEAGFVGDPAHLLGFREIEAHGGFAAQNSIEAHFGLPGRSTVDVRITWPGSGGTHLTQDVIGAPVPLRAVIHEGVDPVSSPVQTGSTDQPWRVSPNPMRDSTMLVYAGANADANDRRFEIVNVTGRIVRALQPLGSPEMLRAVWDGRDRGGSRVAPGVYYVRLEGTPNPPARVTVLR